MRRKCSITPTPLLNLGGLGVHFDATYSKSAQHKKIVHILVQNNHNSTPKFVINQGCKNPGKML